MVDKIIIDMGFLKFEKEIRGDESLEEALNDLADEVLSKKEQIFALKKRFEKTDLRLDISEPTLQKSLTEFLMPLRLASNPDTATMLAYYAYKWRTQETFNSKELLGLFREAMIKTPQNISDVISKCRRRALMMPVGDEDGNKSYSLTQSGIRYCEGLLKNAEENE